MNSVKFSIGLHSRPIFALVVLIYSLLVYSSTFNGTWVMDDYSVIVNNPDIRSLGNFFANTFPGRPIREISYLFDYSLFGLDPRGYHFQNIFWHALNCWLVYRLAIRLNLTETVARLSSLLFLVHPIHVEVVANSSHRKDSLALAFMLMALISYMKIFEHKSTSQRLSWLACAFVLWITAFFAKGNTLVFPVLVLAYEYALIPLNNRMILRWKHTVPLLCASSLIGLVVWYFYVSTLPSFQMAVMGAFLKTGNFADFSASAYILMVFKSFVFMFSKLVFPINLSMEYIYAAPKSILDPWLIAALVLISGLFVIAFRWKRTSPQLFFLLIFAAFLWLPTANIVWYFSYFAADRYMYAPSAGFCILAVLISEHTLGFARRYFVVGWLGILCVLSILTWKQNNVWRDEMSLYTQMLKVSPRSLEAMVGLSKVYYSSKDYDRSAIYAQKAMERDITDYRPYMMLGNIYFALNRLNESLELLLESQKKNPMSPEVYNALGSVYDDMGKQDLAIESFKTALNLRPDYFQANTNLGVTYERANNLPEAEWALNRAIAANGRYAPAWYNLGIVRYRKNDKIGARQAFYEAVNCDSLHMDALVNLSVVCKEMDDAACYSDALHRINLVPQKKR